MILARAGHEAAFSYAPGEAQAADARYPRQSEQSERLCRAKASVPYLQPEILNDASRVLQLNVPFVCKYSDAYQNVQSSDGSMAMLE